MSVEKRALESMVEKVNNATDEKQAIIYMVEEDKKIKEKLKEREEKARETEEEIKEFDFNPNDIETIVFRERRKENNIRKDTKNTFREDIKVTKDQIRNNLTNERRKETRRKNINSILNDNIEQEK